MPLHFRSYPIPRRLLLACLASALAPGVIHAADERRDEEALFFRTLESQGGRSHASGERPDLGPVLTAPVLTEPPPATFRHTENNEYVFPTGSYPGTHVDPALRGIHDSTGPLTEDLTTEAGVLRFYTTVYPGSSEVSPTSGNPLTSLHRWTRTRTAAELLARLKESFAVPASASVVSDVVTTLRGASGRMMRVVVSGDWGSTTVQGWSDIRRLVSVSGVTPGGTGATSAPNSPSTYELTRDGLGNVVSIAFRGGGFGHNVGMSQYGAQGRARCARCAGRRHSRSCRGTTPASRSGRRRWRNPETPEAERGCRSRSASRALKSPPPGGRVAASP